MKKQVNVTVVVPKGMFGANSSDGLLEKTLREIAYEAGGRSVIEWDEKYGTNFENDIFMIHRYCWCEKDDCPWCGEEERENFWYKPKDFKLSWYKYIGRSMEMNKDLTDEEIIKMKKDCIDSLNK